MRKRVFFFGTGADAEQAYLKFQSYKEFCDDIVLGFLDNSFAKQGKMFHQYEVLSPNVLGNKEFELIVICSVNYQYEIREQLLNEFSVPSEKIIFWRAYLSVVNVSYQYRKYCARLKNNLDTSALEHDEHLNINIGLDTSKTIVYTAMEGQYDELKDPEFIGENIKYVCFTDNRNLHSDIWEIRYVDPPEDKNYALDIRKYKALPHRYFPDSSLTIWVDASFRIVGNLNDYVRKYSKTSGFLCFPHPERKCIYQECGELISIGKENPARLIRQAAAYLSEGYPENNGLYAGGVLVRNPNDDKLNKCMEDWWEEIQTRSLRDQQSLPYVLWKNDYEVDLCDLDINDNPYLKNRAHNMGHWRQQL